MFEDSTDREWKCEIQIQSSKVATTQSDFPVVLTEACMPSEIFAASTGAQDGGGDIRFSSDEDGDTQLACDIIDFDQTNDECEMVVNVASVSSSSNTSIWIWWKTSGSSSQPGVSTTYGQYNAYNDDIELWLPGGETTGRTSNAWSFTNSGCSSISGKVGASAWDCSSGTLKTSSTTAFSGTVSFLFWAKDSNSLASNRMYLGKYSPFGYYIAQSNVGGDDCNMFNGATSFKAAFGNPADGTWWHASVSVSSTGGEYTEIFYNGATTATDTATMPGLNTNSAPLIIGELVSAWSGAEGMDNVVILDAPLHGTGALTDFQSVHYENTNDPGAFAIEQTAEETAGAVEYSASFVSAAFSVDSPGLAIALDAGSVSSAFSAVSPSFAINSTAGSVASSFGIEASTMSLSLADDSTASAQFSVVAASPSLTKTYAADAVSSSFSVEAPSTAISAYAYPTNFYVDVPDATTVISISGAPVPATFSLTELINTKLEMSDSPVSAAFSVEPSTIQIDTSGSPVAAEFSLVEPSITLVLNYVASPVDSSFEVVSPTASLAVSGGYVSVSASTVPCETFTIAVDASPITMASNVESPTTIITTQSTAAIDAAFSVVAGVPTIDIQFFVNAQSVHVAGAKSQMAYSAGSQAQEVAK